MMRQINEVNKKDIKYLGGGIWREKTPEEKLVDRLVERGKSREDAEKATEFFGSIIKTKHGYK